MPRKLPPHVERNRVKGHVYYSFRKGKGPRTRLPDYGSPEFATAYAAAMAGTPAQVGPKKDGPGTLGELIASYFKSSAYVALRQSSKEGYMRRINLMREAHGHRTVAGLSRDRIITKIL